MFEQIMLCVWCTASANLPKTWSHRGWADYRADVGESEYTTFFRFYGAVFPYWVEFDDEFDYGV